MEGPRKLLCNKNIFLSNNTNKQSFINFLGRQLTERGVTVRYCREDADLDIVRTAVGQGKKTDVVLYGDDTDLLVLAVHYINQIVLETKIYMFRPSSASCIDIQHIIDSHDDSIIGNILPIHAMSGCDTVSQPYGVGKTKLVKLVMKNPEIGDALQQFNLPLASNGSIQEAGLRILASLYVGCQKKSTNYGALRSM